MLPFKVGQHDDDLVTAFGLAVQEDRAPVVADPRVSGYWESSWPHLRIREVRISARSFLSLEEGRALSITAAY